MAFRLDIWLCVPGVPQLWLRAGCRSLPSARLAGRNTTESPLRSSRDWPLSQPLGQNLDIELKLRNIKRQGLFGDVCGYDGNGPLFYRKYRCRITEPFVEIIGPLYA